MIDTINILTHLSRNPGWWVSNSDGLIADLHHRQIPVRFYSLHDIYQSERNCPVIHFWRIRIEGKELQLDRIELIDGDRGFMVRVEIFIQLFEDGAYLKRRFWVGEKG